jgi:hypothetical protein
MHALEPPPSHTHRERIDPERSMTPRLIRCVPRQRSSLGAAPRVRQLCCAVAKWSVLAAGAAVFLGLLTLPRNWGRASSKADIARITVRKYAHEGFPAWASDRPDGACPASLDELRSLAGIYHDRDPWGRYYHHRCTWSRPTTLVVWSDGEDRTPGTGDDIWSDR